MSDYPEDPRVEYLRNLKSSNKKWQRFTWGITLADRTAAFNYVNLTRTTLPSNGYITNHDEYSFIPDEDIFEAEGAYQDFLIFSKPE